MCAESCGLMVFWSWGRGLEDNFDDAHHQRLTHLIVKDRSQEQTALRLPSSPVVKIHKLPLEESGSSHALHTLTQKDAEPEDEMVKPVVHEDSDLYFQKDDGSLVPLARIPVMSIFHKNASTGQGVPHAFATFLQRYPALPDVVVCLLDFRRRTELIVPCQIFLSTIIVAIPHVGLGDRYVVSKVRSIEGFYSVTMR